MKRKSDSDSEGVGAKDARTGVKASPGASECVSDGVSEEQGSAAPITPPLSHSLPSYSVAGEPYSVHASDAVAGDERVEEWFAKLNHSLSKSSKHFDSRIRAVVGLDCEWCPPWFRDNKPERVNTIQLYSPFADCLVLSVGEWASLPTALVEMLADETIAKVGVNISGDGARLARDFDVPVCGLLNLEKGLGPKMTMEKLCSKYCPSEFHISKDSVESKVRLGNWASWPLSTLQLKYASMDAVLSFAIFLFQQKGSWEGRQELLLPKVADCTLDTCRPLPVAERKELQRAPSTGGKNSNFFLMHQNRSIVPPNMNNKEHPRGDKEALRGVVVVVSGVLDSMSRDEMSAYVVSHGGKVAKSITKKTTHLVNDHGAVGPSKLEKCKAQGVPVVGEDHILGLVRTSSTSSQAGAAADSVPAAGAE